jgi:hypothetical protein
LSEIAGRNGAKTAKGATPPGPGDEATAFFKFTAPSGGINTLDLNVSGWSNAEIWVNGGMTVPEPATWAMMLLGVGAIGSAMRASRRSSKALAAA